jgi:hypothetical protein
MQCYRLCLVRQAFEDGRHMCFFKMNFSPKLFVRLMPGLFEFRPSGTNVSIVSKKLRFFES